MMCRARFLLLPWTVLVATGHDFILSMEALRWPSICFGNRSLCPVVAVFQLMVLVDGSGPFIFTESV
ncbi:hypothetical protein MA16_Dca023576 [Dendrobium catenatum]|uniref:Secreted protein n=1 Tax=Dendrobium catenatum TaxID=906689 RepID=A0A2I0XII5_9ASPA|nr:hypothetical protein MA16_Dca023576 [Dendrobium catenatum]